VKGTALEDGKWVAYSIERAEEQTDPSPTIVFIGKVTSTDPWVVNGITLNVTAGTVINGTIAVGMLVRVEVLLAEDGTWEVLSLTPLGDFSEVDGCVTVAATIVSVTADEIQFVGWPSMPLDSDVKIESNGNEAENQGDQQGDIVLSPNQNVLVVLCPTDNNQIVIAQIILIVINPPEEGGNESPGGNQKVLVCHKPNKNAHTLSIPQSAVPAHLGHGDKLGPCP